MRGTDVWLEAPLGTLTSRPQDQPLPASPGKEWAGALAEGGGARASTRGARPEGAPTQSHSSSPPLDPAPVSAGHAQGRRPPSVARLPVSTSFSLSASEPGTNAQSGVHCSTTCF